MSKLLLRLTLALLILFTAFIGLIRFAVSGAATPPHLFSFDPPDCYLPCVFGITPGKTTVAEYKALMTSKVPPGQQTLGEASDFWLTGDPSAKVGFLADPNVTTDPQNTITLLLLTTNDERGLTTLGRLLDIQHEPTRVFRFPSPIDPDGEGLLFTFGTTQRVAALIYTDDMISPDTPINFMTIFDSADTMNHELLEVFSAKEISWLGFGSVEKYIDAPVKH